MFSYKAFLDQKSLKPGYLLRKKHKENELFLL
jgi:hypothetical protein